MPRADSCVTNHPRRRGEGNFARKAARRFVLTERCFVGRQSRVRIEQPRPTANPWADEQPSRQPCVQQGIPAIGFSIAAILCVRARSIARTCRGSVRVFFKTIPKEIAIRSLQESMATKVSIASFHGSPSRETERSFPFVRYALGSLWSPRHACLSPPWGSSFERGHASCREFIEAP